MFPLFSWWFLLLILNPQPNAHATSKATLHWESRSSAESSELWWLQTSTAKQELQVSIHSYTMLWRLERQQNPQLFRVDYHATELSVDHPGLFGQVITVVDAPSCRVTCQNVLKFKIEFKIQHTAHTMDGDDPDSFESNLCRILQARELGKTAVLMSNLIPNFGRHQPLNWLAYQAKIMLNAKPTAAHHLIASRIRKIY